MTEGADRRATFDEDAAGYDLGRPGYPAELYDELVARCGLGPETRVLEIGCGTGQATRELLDRGAVVTAVELGPSLAALAREKLAGRAVEVRTGAFENQPLEPASFDLAASATAFHWVDAAVALPRIADALVAGGWLALWWTIFGDPDRPDPFRAAAQPAFDRWQPRIDSQAGVDRTLSDLERIVDATETSGRFGPIERRQYAWEGQHDPGQLRQLFSTHSTMRAMPEDDRAALLDALEGLARDRFGGQVVRPYLTVLFLARRS